MYILNILYWIDLIGLDDRYSLSIFFFCIIGILKVRGVVIFMLKLFSVKLKFIFKMIIKN